MIRILMLVCTCLAMMSCDQQPKHLSARGYVEWMKSSENGYVKSREMMDVVFTVFRQTKEYREALAITRQVETPSVKPHREENEQYILRISPREGSVPLLERMAKNESEYLGLMEYFNTKFREDISIENGNGTEQTTPIAFQCVPNYRTAPYLEFVFAFDIKNTSETQKIAINDVVFGNGPIYFTFKSNTQPLLIRERQ